MKEFLRDYRNSKKNCGRKYNLGYIVLLSVLIFLFEVFAQHLKVIENPITWGALIILMLIFNWIWDRTHPDYENGSGEKVNKGRGGEDI